MENHRQVWGPFFGNGSQVILNSRISHILPIPDTALGALGHLADVITGVIGGPKRWKNMPWMVILFGIFVGPLGLISVLLVILQPTLFHTWCILCLVTAVISVLMIAPAMDEVLLSLQYVVGEKRAATILAQMTQGTALPFRARGLESAWICLWNPEKNELIEFLPMGYFMAPSAEGAIFEKSKSTECANSIHIQLEVSTPFSTLKKIATDNFCHHFFSH